MRLFPNLKIAQKLPLALVGSALLVSAGVGIASHLVGSATVMDLLRRQIGTVASHRADASVEAARAGEAGKGFAVVAVEVRPAGGGGLSEPRQRGDRRGMVGILRVQDTAA